MDLHFARDIVRSLMRRFFLFSTIAFLGTLGAVLYALSLDHVYQATAVVQIRDPQVSTDMIDGGPASSTARRLQQIEQQLTSRNSLFEVADKYDLFTGDPEMNTSDRLYAMRQSIRLNRIAGVQTGYGRPPEPSGLIITVRLTDAEKTALVANEFVSRLMESNLRERERRTAETLGFFRREEAQLSRQIADIDDRIVAYKARNSGSLPEGLEFRRDELARLGEDQRDISRQLMALERERLGIEEGGSDEAGSLAPLRMELQSLQVRLSRLRAAVPNHPDIPRLESQISALSSDDDAVRRQTAERQQQLINDEASLLQAQADEIAQRRAQLAELIAASPAVELSLSVLLREREHLQEQLTAAIQSRSEAEMLQRLETNRQAERFEVLESALVPLYPVEPSRKKIAAAGAAASILLGAGLVILLDLLKPVIRSSSQFQRALGTAPTIALPYVETVWERRRRRLTIAAALLIVFVGLPGSLFLLDRHVMSFEEMAAAFGRLPISVPTL